MTALEERKMKSIACKYCDRLKNPEFKNDDMARCFRYDSCTNPNDRCSRFILSIPESMMDLTGPLDGYKDEGIYCARPDGSLVISLSDEPEIESKIRAEEERPKKDSQNKTFIILIFVSLICSLFFFIYGSSFHDDLFTFMGWVCAANMLLSIVLLGIYSNSAR